jgi:hypothetical protein
MNVYFRNDRKDVTLSMTPTPANVTRLTERLENVGHKLHMRKYCPSPVLLYDLHTRTIICCGTGRPKRK